MTITWISFQNIFLSERYKGSHIVCESIIENREGESIDTGIRVVFAKDWGQREMESYYLMGTVFFSFGIMKMFGN